MGRWTAMLLVALLTQFIIPRPLAAADFTLVAGEAFAPPYKAAPDFTLKDDSGQTLGLADLRGNVVLLGFFTTW